MPFLRRLLSRSRITGGDDLERFFEARAAFAAQKCVIEYCRARAGLNWQRLFSEGPFQQAVHAASWGAWRYTLLDVAEMLDSVLRPHAGDVRALQGWIGAGGARIIARQQFPAHLPPAFAAQVQAGLDALMAELARREPAPVKDIPRRRAQAVFELIPIHESLKAPDADYIFNTLRAALVRAADDLHHQADLPTLAAQLTGG